LASTSAINRASRWGAIRAYRKAAGAGDSSVWVSCGACIDAGRRGRFGTALTVNVPIQPGRAGVSRCFGYVVCLSSEQARSALARSSSEVVLLRRRISGINRRTRATGAHSPSRPDTLAPEGSSTAGAFLRALAVAFHRSPTSLRWCWTKALLNACLMLWTQAKKEKKKRKPSSFDNNAGLVFLYRSRGRCR
jgi:hypothetical protein